MKKTSKGASPADDNPHADELRAALMEYRRHYQIPYDELKQLGMWPFRYTHERIQSVRDFKETLRAGDAAWPGGYPLYFITADSEPLSFEAARENYRTIIEAMSGYQAPDWRIVGCEANWENHNLYCTHTGKKIEAAYGADDE